MGATPDPKDKLTWEYTAQEVLSAAASVSLEVCKEYPDMTVMFGLFIEKVLARAEETRYGEEKDDNRCNCKNCKD